MNREKRKKTGKVKNRELMKIEFNWITYTKLAVFLMIGGQMSLNVDLMIRVKRHKRKNPHGYGLIIIIMHFNIVQSKASFFDTVDCALRNMSGSLKLKYQHTHRLHLKEEILRCVNLSLLEWS